MRKALTCFSVRKATSIFLLLLLAFNLFGYRLLFFYVSTYTDVTTEAKIDQNDYDEASLVTISVPLPLPYQTNWPEFERTSGEINLDGMIYTCVQQRVLDGKLFLKCLPNHAKMNLETAKQDFFKLANDLQKNDGSEKSKNAIAQKHGNAEFYFTPIFVYLPCNLKHEVEPVAVCETIITRHCSDFPGQPPDQIEAIV